MPELEVRLYGEIVGHLEGERSEFDFHATPASVEKHGVGSLILSLAVPLTTNPRASDRYLRRNFFEEMLAEGSIRDQLARKERLDTENTMALLARYGRDVAGAVQIIDPNDPEEPRTPSLRTIDNDQIRGLFDAVKRSPLGNTSRRRLSSLAGVQDKVLLTKDDGRWAEPLDGYPSTHILKPSVVEFPTMIFDEEFGARIARHLELASFDTSLEQFSGMTALVIERYDRDAGERIHQEDFNQVLGLAGDEKYEENGGAGLAMIAERLREEVHREAVEQLLVHTVMSVAVGNLDMHAKNLSVMHRSDNSLDLAPAYDIVPQMHQELDNGFAFSIDGELDHERITRNHLVSAGSAWGVRNAETLVDETLEKISAFVGAEVPAEGAHPGLAEDIVQFCANLRSGKGASEPSAGPRPRPARALRELPGAAGGWGGPGR